MAHLLGLARLRSMRATTALAVIASLHLVASTESSHTHGDHVDPAGACSVCQLVHNPGSTVGAATPSVPGPGLLPARPLPSYRTVPGFVHFTPRHSRAPPPFISL